MILGWLVVSSSLVIGLGKNRDGEGEQDSSVCFIWISGSERRFASCFEAKKLGSRFETCVSSFDFFEVDRLYFGDVTCVLGKLICVSLLVLVVARDLRGDSCSFYCATWYFATRGSDYFLYLWAWFLKL